MKLKRFKDWSYFGKNIAVTVLIMAGVSAGVLFYYLPVTEQNIVNEKRSALKSLVDVAVSLIGEYDSRVKKGELTLEQAKEQAKASVKGLRYKKNEYFWINDLQPVMVMHPINADLDGKSLGDMKDPHGVYLFKEFVTMAKSSGEGFLDYMWNRPDSTQPYPKVSYIKLYEPWGWIIGTGIYIDDVKRQMAALRIQIVLATLIFVFLVIVLSLYVSRLVTRPLARGVEIMNRLAEGDLSMAIEVDREDEAGQLLRAMNEMVKKLGAMIITIKSSAECIASASEELSASSVEMSRGVSNQSDRASQIATSSTEMSQTVVDIAGNASNIASSAMETTKVADEGRQIVTQSVTTVMAIADTVRESSQLVTSLGSRSTQIGNIIQVIKDIADQTNLLALNAAIEAARAGEQGRGFAVVADEVRKLAERTAKATSEISGMIGSIQEEVHTTVGSMSEVTRRVETGVQYVTRAGDSLGHIVESVGNLHDMVNQIASATEEMSAVSETITSDIDAIAGVSRDAALTSGQIADSATDLAKLSAELQAMVNHFTLLEDVGANLRPRRSSGGLLTP